VRALEKCISVLGMRFKRRGQGKIKPILIVLCLISAIIPSFMNDSSAELIDRVVAVINREVILYSELQEAVEHAKDTGEEKSEREILEELIDRTLLLEQAMKFQVEIETYNRDGREARKVIDDYINRRIKAFIHVPFDEIDRYYISHKDEFGGRNVYEVWDKIENRLRIEQLKAKLDEHISLLKKEASIRIQLENK